MVKMNESLVNKYLKEMEELVFEEGKIVTYKFLSRQLHIHVNTAKQLMYTFKLQSKGEWQDLISCTYLVSGIKTDGSHIIAVVNEKDLSELKATLKETVAEHVFSLQKMPYVEDIQVLLAAEPFPSDSTISPIKCSESLINREPTVSKAPVVVPSIKKEDAPKKSESKSPLKSKIEPVTVPKGTNSGTDNQKGKKTEKQPARKATGSITSMFSAQNQKAKTALETKTKAETETARTPSASTSKVETKKEVAKESKREVADEPKKVVDKTKKVVEESKGKQVGKKPAAKKRKTKESDKPLEKKRKRIQVFSDSDESDEEATREKSPSPEPEPDTEPMVIIDEEPVVSSGHKTKKRKIVDKHVMTDDGFMETKKEVVFETDSEPDETAPPLPVKPSPPTKKTPPEPAKKAQPSKHTSPAKKGRGKSAPSDGKKQASLLSFFKKS